MALCIKRTIQGALIVSSLALSACGDSSDGGNNANTQSSALSINETSSNSDLLDLLAQGLINEEAIDLDDNANRQTDDRQDAFDL